MDPLSLILLFVVIGFPLLAMDKVHKLDDRVEELEKRVQELGERTDDET